ncbi:MAG: AAA family ATPase [Pseudodesulfovibrio sp.]
MITKIILENFMAHERTELELGPGVNALTGPNNSGKSAIVEALRCVATNPVPKHYIRHGAKEARVTLEFEDKTQVVWVRKKRSSGYEIWHPGAEEPEQYWKFGRKPPEDVLDVLKLDLVELENGGEIDVHVGNQREPVFLLNQPGSNAAAFFAASTESAHLLAMQNVLKRKTLDAKRQERDQVDRLGGLESEMDQFSPLPDIAVQVENAQELGATANELQAYIPLLENVIVSQINVEKSLTTRSVTATILKRVVKTPELKEVSQLQGLIKRIVEIDTVQIKAVETGRSLAPLTNVPETFDTARLTTLCGKLQLVENRLQKAQMLGAVSIDIAEPPKAENLAQLSDIMSKILIVRSRFGREARRDVVLQSIVEPPEVQPDVHLASLLVGLRGLEQEKEARKASLSVLEMELQLMKDTINKRLEDLGCCPTCGGDVESAAFLDRRCRHDA